MAQQWYCRAKEQEIGPISARDLRRLARIGKINPQTEVRLEADGPWLAAGLVPGLFSAKPRKKANGPPRQNPAAAALAAMNAQQPQAVDLEDFDPDAVVAEHHDAATDLDDTNEPADADDVTIQLGDGAPPIQVKAPPLSAGASPLSGDRAVRMKRQVNLLSVLAAFFAFVAVALYGVPALPILVGLLAVILAVRALGKVDTRRGIGYGLPATAAVLSAFAVCFGVYSTFFYHDGIADLQSMFESSPRVAEETPEDEPWRNATSGAIPAGDVAVEVQQVAVGPLGLGQASRSERQRSEVGENVLFITLAIENVSPHRKLEYTSWSGAGGGSVTPELTDNFGNQYKWIRLRRSLPGVEQIGRTSLYPGKSIEDTLLFEAPVDTAKQLRLRLPLRAVAGQGEMRIEIPSQMIGRRDPPVYQLAIDPPPEQPTEQQPQQADDEPLIDFSRDPQQGNLATTDEPAGDESLDRLAEEDPSFDGGGFEIPKPGEAWRNAPPVDLPEEDVIDNGQFVQSPFAGRDDKPQRAAEPQPKQQPVAPAQKRVIDPVLPRHGQPIAKPELVSEEDWQPPRNDPFRKLDD